MNLGNLEPTVNSEDPEDVDRTLDSIRGRRFLVTPKRSW